MKVQHCSLGGEEAFISSVAFTGGIQFSIVVFCLALSMSNNCESKQLNEKMACL